MSRRTTYIKSLTAASATLLLMMALTIYSNASVVKEINPAPSHKTAPSLQKHQTFVKLTPGKFLIAKRGMKDRRFAQTVILVIEHNEQGASGLIINRPTSITVRDAIPAINVVKIATDKVYIGGPVNSNTLSMLIRAPKLPEGAVHIFKDIYVSTKAKTLNQTALDDWLVANFRVYAGYAGWGPLQLDKELLHNDWYVTDGDAASIFDTKAEDIWPGLMLLLEH